MTVDVTILNHRINYTAYLGDHSLHGCVEPAASGDLWDAFIALDSEHQHEMRGLYILFKITTPSYIEAVDYLNSEWKRINLMEEAYNV